MLISKSSNAHEFSENDQQDGKRYAHKVARTDAQPQAVPNDESDDRNAESRDAD